MIGCKGFRSLTERKNGDTIPVMNDISKPQEEELSRKLLNLILRFNEYDRKTRNFGTDTVLHLSEIHLIEFIGDHGGFCVSEIARETGVTKGAVSQTLKRLERKRFVLKPADPENRSRRVVFLTEKGRTAYAGHRKYHEQINLLVSRSLVEKTQEEIDIIYDFLDRLERLL